MAVILTRIYLATLRPNLKANNEDESKCVELRKGFEKGCPPTWVTHFDRDASDLNHI